MKNQQLTTTRLNQIIEQVFPTLSGNGLTYNKRNNMYLTSGYTSNAGNTYFNGIQLSDRLIIQYDLGQGYFYLFLNGIKIYCFNGTEKQLISSKTYQNFIYSEYDARRECIEMVSEYMTSQIKMINGCSENDQIRTYSEKLIEATNVSM